MLTVKDINNKRFEPVKNGYNTMEVDEFLKQCSNALKVALSENEDMRQKLTILADSVRDYQKKESDIAGALLDIQRTKRFALEEAQNDARKIISDAHDQAKAILGNTSAKLHSEAAAYERLKKEVALFKENILAMYKEHLSIFTAIPDEYDDSLDSEDTNYTGEAAPASPVDEVPVGAESNNIFSEAAEGFTEPVYEETYAENIAGEAQQNTSDNTGDDQSELYEQAFGAKPIPGKTDKLDGLRFGQNV